MILRCLIETDFPDAHTLYQELVGTIDVPDDAIGLERFKTVLLHPGTQIIGAEINQRIVSMATLHILPNMTFSARPYALIENVVTARDHRQHGIGRKVMQTAIDIAWGADAYKIMLLAGKSFKTKGFYKQLGFNACDKHGLILRRAPQRNPII